MMELFQQRQYNNNNGIIFSTAVSPVTSRSCYEEGTGNSSTKSISDEAYQHQVKGGGPEGSPSIHALCPFGGLESLLTFLTTGRLLDKIYFGTLALFIVSVILTIILRRSFCGWICPLGDLQEFFGLAGKKIMRKNFSIPAAVDRYLRFLKYIVLLLIIVMSWRTASLWFAPYDPWAAYGHISEGIPSVWKEFTV